MSENKSKTKKFAYVLSGVFEDKDHGMLFKALGVYTSRKKARKAVKRYEKNKKHKDIYDLYAIEKVDFIPSFHKHLYVVYDEFEDVWNDDEWTSLPVAIFEREKDAKKFIKKNRKKYDYLFWRKTEYFPTWKNYRKRKNKNTNNSHF